jgi:hypothetical protein
VRTRMWWHGTWSTLFSSICFSWYIFPLLFFFSCLLSPILFFFSLFFSSVFKVCCKDPHVSTKHAHTHTSSPTH